MKLNSTPRGLHLLSTTCLLLGFAQPAAAQITALNTQRVGFISLPGSSSTKGLWAYETGGRQYCLQTRGSAGLAVIDMTNTSNPTLVSNVPGTFRKVAVYQNFAYATTDGGVTVVVDLTDPAQASVVGSMPVSGHTLRVDDSNGRLYLNRSSSINIYDLTANPTAPALLGTWIGAAHDCRPDGQTLYVHGFTTPPTKILNVSNPALIDVLGTVPSGNHAGDLWLAPDGRKVLLTCDETTGGHLQLWDVSVPAQPVALAQYQTSTAASIHNVEVKGAYAYVSYYKDQLRILDLSDPANPEEVGVWDNNPLNTGSLYSDAWESIPDHDAVYMNQMNNTLAGAKGTHAIDFFPAFGQGSEGAGGARPEIWWSFGPASPGNNRFVIRLENAAPNAGALLILGFSNTQWGTQALPLGMGLIGAPNAQLFVSPDVLSFSTTTDVDGKGSVALPIPPGVPFLTFYVQWVVQDPGAPNPGGLAFTKAGKIIVY